MKTVAIIQARLTSKRFPGKVLEKVGGKSMIARICEAARRANLVDKVVLAWAHKFPHLDENDVLGRYREIAEREQADLIVRLTGDCPLIRAVNINNAIVDYMRGKDPIVRRGPDGFDVQVFASIVLQFENWTDREHVIKPGIEWPKMFSVDTPADLEMVRAYA